MSDVKSQLEENATDEYKKVHVTYRYSNRDIEENLVYFKDCMINDLSPYKALLWFSDYLENKNVNNIFKITIQSWSGDFNDMHNNETLKTSVAHGDIRELKNSNINEDDALIILFKQLLSQNKNF